MELMREAWTDERLDDGFDRVSGDIRELRSEIGSLRTETTGEFVSVRREFAAFRAEMKDEFAAVRLEMKDEFATVRGEINQQFGSLREENIALWGEINGRIDGMQQTMIRFGGAMIVSMMALILTVLLRGA